MAFDILVIGAGPAGALAAGACARRGASVLLVERATFPRDKVCGCCVNRAATATLRACGQETLLDALGARRVDSVALSSGGAATVRTAPMRVLSRAALDDALVHAAVNDGATFLPATTAIVGGEDDRGVIVRLTPRGGAARSERRARCVLVADGLGGTALRERSDFATTVMPGSRFGAAALLDPAAHPAAAAAARAGAIVMLSGREGYAGIVRLEDGRINVAAALDPHRTRAAGGPGAVVCRLLRAAGHDVALAGAAWHGTPALTRSRARIETTRVLVIGDAAGYVEPFTGEGLAWALRCGAIVAPIALERCAARPAVGAWRAAYRDAIASRRRACRSLAWLLRRPRLAHVAIRALGCCPGLAAPLTWRLGAPAGPGERPDAISAGKAVSA